MREKISFVADVILVISIITISIILTVNHSESSSEICNSLGWESNGGQCFCQNTTYNLKGERTIIKQEYKKELGCD